MFGLFTRSSAQKASLLFEDKFNIIDLDAIKWKQRGFIKSHQNVSLYSNVASLNNEEFVYYEIVYSREKLFSFVVFHNTAKDEAYDLFEKFKLILSIFDKSISSTKMIAFENLRSIMNCLRINSSWTSTHIAARLGMDTHLKEFANKTTEEINEQISPDKLTPLHLAIQSFHFYTVKTLLEFKPNLDLLDYKCFSILHFAAISTEEILSTILYQEGMFDRILWKNYQGCTALHLACYVQKFDNIIEFLKFGLTPRMLTLSPPRHRSKNAKTPHRAHHSRPSSRSKIVKFTEQDYNDLDFQDIFSGGSPLHWAKHKRLIEKLIAYRFNLNIKNLNGDSPLHIMAKRSRLKCAITLLCCGVNVDAQNIFGNSPLHHSVKNNDIIITQTLIVFDANINAKNLVNESIRHLAAKEMNYNQEMILYLLSALGAERCPADTQGCTAGCCLDGTFEGRYNQNLFDMTKNINNKFYKNTVQFEKIINETLSQTPSDTNNSKRANLLALDGGGIKGLVTIQVLMEIEKKLQYKLQHYFKWMAGTSTGSFIVVFMALGRSLKQIRSIYFQFKDKVMIGSRPYDSEAFESIIKDEIGSELKMEDIKTKYGKHLVVPCVLFDRRPMRLHICRSYESPMDLLGIPDFDPGYPPHPSKEQFAWKACRASGAAPTYFRASGPFIDGGLISNNPTLDAMTEFQFYNSALKTIGREDECDTLNMVLSIGTGKFKVEENEILDISSIYSFNPIDINNNIRYIKQMFNLLIYEICNTENHVVNRAEAFCSGANVPYFRINCPLSEVVDLDEQFDFKLINTLWETKRYMHLMREQVQQLVQFLEKSRQTIPDNCSISSGQSAVNSVVSNTSSRSSTTSTHSSNEARSPFNNELSDYSFKENPNNSN